MSEYVTLSYWDLAGASIFLIVNGLVSLKLQLGVERQLLWSALRMVVQLLFIGLVLKAVFAATSPAVTLILALIMIGFAGREVWARQDRKLAGIWGIGLGAGATMFGGTVVTVVSLSMLIGPTPWWSPQYALPLFGMVLGNTMTGVSLALDTLHSRLYRERVAVEAQLLLGRTRWEATGPFLRQALRSGFNPILNTMAVTGVVSIPGMMTGQILSGVDPQEAVKYQLLIMFLIGGATGIGVLGAVVVSAWRLTDTRHRLRLDRLQPKAA